MKDSMDASQVLTRDCMFQHGGMDEPFEASSKALVTVISGTSYILTRFW